MSDAEERIERTMPAESLRDLDLTVATDADVPAIVGLINRAFRGKGDDESWSTQEHYIEGTRTTIDMLREEMSAHPDAKMLLWRRPDGSLLGCVWMQPEANGVWYLGSLSIDPREQNGGLGQRLLAATEEWARARGAREIRMTVVQIRAALLAWYARRGYVLTGETKPFPYGDERYGRPTRDDLHFVVLRKRLLNGDMGS
jgi:GNAT superfamily N-acetyltransferase